jgi:transcriptional regulator with XRE-family HTH domain
VRTVPTPREQLAEVLRQSRLDGGFESHGALAKKLNVSRPVISKAENPAHPVPSDALLASWAGATGVPLDTLTDLAERARSGTPDWFMPYRQAEAEASILRCWSPLLVPGLLQTESYMRAVLSVEPYSAGQLEELVSARLERQAVIGRAYLTAVIDQHALHRLIGSAQVMAEQCAHLLSMAERPDIALHVVPEGSNVGLWGAFNIAARDSTTTVCLIALEDIPSTAPGLVGKVTVAFERILGAALPRVESHELIVKVAEELWKMEQWKRQI